MIELNIFQNNQDGTDYIETSLSGEALLNTAKLNKGCAFTLKERNIFELNGLLPYQIETLEQQVARMYAQYHEHHTNLAKNIYLNVLHDYNETLFYKLVSQNLEEMLPIIYTPTVGEAVQRFSLELRKPRGLYITFNDRDRIKKILDQHLSHNIDLTVVTDGEAVLGIGDQGIGGINIASSKLMAYTLCGGFNPHRILPIQLDVGTNNPHLLNDPMYLGWRHERITGQAYDDFIDTFIQAITKKLPFIFLHWEDFGSITAHHILQRYQKKFCTFNGDIQGTAIIVLASVLAATLASDIPLQDHRIAILGASSVGIGIANQLLDAMHRSGLNEQEARSRFWVLDKSNLLIRGSTLQSYQEPYARDQKDLAGWQLRDPKCISLYDVIKNVKPTILIGYSTIRGAFTEEIVSLMASHAKRPIILPLSNPDSLCEAQPEDLLKWTHGTAIIATGSPFPNVLYKDKWYRFPQCNNAFAFPGIGLGTVAVKAKYLTEDMLWAASQAIKDCSPIKQDKMAALLPRFSESKMVSFKVALAVAEQAQKEGIAQISHKIDLKEIIQKMIWEPRYYPYRKK